MHSAEYWIRHLDLQPHPEGGFFRETYRASLGIAAFGGSRDASTAIYFLLAGDAFSALHRLRSDEVWHFYAGCALLVHSIDPEGNYRVVHLGQNPDAGEQFQCVVPTGCWFGCSVEQQDTYALAGCTVAPGFDFADFEMGRRAELLAQYPQHREVIEKLTSVG